MEVLRLEPQFYLPDLLVNNLSTVIWTERYQEPGEFEIRSSLIEKTMSLLPESSLITLQDTDEIMIVESHEVTYEQDAPVLVVKGRSAETILEHRVFTDAKYGKNIKMQRNYTIQDALLVFLYDAIANTTTKTVSTAGGYSANPNDYVYGISLTDSTTTTTPSLTRRLENVNVWDQMRFWIGAGKFGIRMIRPLPNPPSRKTAHVTAAGVITKPLETTDLICMDIYDGLDRTSQQTVRDPVVFSHEQNQIDDPSYLFSSKDYKNVAIVISASGPLHGKEVIRPLSDSRTSGGRLGPTSPSRSFGFAPGEPHGGTHSQPKGWDRRVRIVDAGTKDDDDTTAEFLASLPDKGLDTLVAENERQTVLDGTISSQAPYKYKRDYNLGDKVTLLGNYGIVEEMQVQEYTRTLDDSGERGFPGLVLWT